MSHYAGRIEPMTEARLESLEVAAENAGLSHDEVWELLREVRRLAAENEENARMRAANGTSMMHAQLDLDEARLQLRKARKSIEARELICIDQVLKLKEEITRLRSLATSAIYCVRCGSWVHPKAPPEGEGQPGL